MGAFRRDLTFANIHQFIVLDIVLQIWASLIAQWVKNPPAMQDSPVQFLGREDLLDKGQATHFSVLRLPCGSAGKESACHAGDLGSIPGWENPLEKGKLPTPVFWPG